jgi:hypothetical protein
MKKGDLVMWKSYMTAREDYGVIIDVADHRGVFPEEVLVKFPLDGTEGWYLSQSLIKMESTSEPSKPSKSLS